MSKIVHTELMSNDPKATADFVGKMFDWKIEKWDDPKMTYYMWNYPGTEEGGGIGGVNDMPNPQPPHISVYVDVDNISKALEKAKTLGATPVMGETAIGDGSMGYFAIMTIPGGVTVGIWCKNPSK